MADLKFKYTLLVSPEELGLFGVKTPALPDFENFLRDNSGHIKNIILFMRSNLDISPVFYKLLKVICSKTEINVFFVLSQSRNGVMRELSITKSFTKNSIIVDTTLNAKIPDCDKILKEILSFDKNDSFKLWFKRTCSIDWISSYFSHNTAFYFNSFLKFTDDKYIKQQTDRSDKKIGFVELQSKIYSIITQLSDNKIALNNIELVILDQCMKSFKNQYMHRINKTVNRFIKDIPHLDESICIPNLELNKIVVNDILLNSFKSKIKNDLANVDSYKERIDYLINLNMVYIEPALKFYNFKGFEENKIALSENYDNYLELNEKLKHLIESSEVVQIDL